MITTGFSAAIAERMAAEHATLAARWFARLCELIPVAANEVFPSDRLLDHIPALIVDISAYVRAPEEEAIAANTLVVQKARELGSLRHQQRASLHQVLREYQLLGTILLTFAEQEATRLELMPSPAECIATVGRIHHAVGVLMQETVETFVGLYTQTITMQSERLRQFTRMATHEWRQPLAPIATSVALLRLPNLNPEQRDQVIGMIDRNVSRLTEMTRTLERVARLDGDETDNATVQEVSVTVIATEAARQLAEMSTARGVRIEIAPDMPTVRLDVGRLELALVNLLSNAIKYSDPAKSDRVVVVTARMLGETDCEICVDDNGIGIPANRIDRIFSRFTRAHADHPELESVSGVGLGLAIVDDCVKALGGSITVVSEPHRGTSFCLTLPRSSV